MFPWKIRGEVESERENPLSCNISDFPGARGTFYRASDFGIRRASSRNYSIACALLTNVLTVKCEEPKSVRHPSDRDRRQTATWARRRRPRRCRAGFFRPSRRTLRQTWQLRSKQTTRELLYLETRNDLSQTTRFRLTLLPLQRSDSAVDKHRASANRSSADSVAGGTSSMSESSSE